MLASSFKFAIPAMVMANDDPPRLSSFGAFTKVAKLRIEDPRQWDHHRGGWKYVCSLLVRELHADDGIRFFSSIEDVIVEDLVVSEPWVGFLHQVPRHNLKWFPDLERLLERERWKLSIKLCRGIFVLSSHVKEFLHEKKIEVPVARIFYPVEATDRLFSFERFAQAPSKRLLFIGEYLRDFQTFYDLKASGFSKQLLVPENFKPKNLRINDSVEMLGRVTDDQYDTLLEESVVFLSLFDAPANTTIIECIARNTPVLVNRLPGVVEYLGEDYPFYYGSLDEAEKKLQDQKLIRDTSIYLGRAPAKPKLTEDYFLNSVQNSAIYRSLPVPPSQSTEFASYDVSVIICSYKRVYNMEALLERFCAQDFKGCFEILVWNNNFAAREQLDEICGKFKSRLRVKLIHSTENFYCVIRLAMTSLIRSNCILVCDDDVKPHPSYIATFLDKYREYGPDAVLCCRGNVFKAHVLNEEEPQRFWTDYEHLRFFDERQTDRQVHFMHADNCLIPKHIMQKAVTYDFPRYDYWLIDDYWLSFVFSHFLKIPIWKIKADTAFEFTPCSDDPHIALYHNPRVAEQRINFYIEHMRQGWPFGEESGTHSEAPPPQVAEPLSKSACWTRGFHGANIFSEASVADFKDAAKCGVRVVRMGAVGGARDLRFLIDESAVDFLLHGESQARLERCMAKAADAGLNVILSLCDVPGRRFRPAGGGYDFRIWSSSEFARKFARMWGALAQNLSRFENVIGYDLMNEPYSPVDTERGFFGEMSDEYSENLNDLYQGAISAIRQHDDQTRIILESTYWASPRTIRFLRPHEDRRIIYSFHIYAPRMLTIRRINGGRFRYPGAVPVRASDDCSELVQWDRRALRELLSEARIWQVEHKIPDANIFVGEFGISRDVPGAVQYLSDLIALFGEFGWSWTVYAFRDEEWDAMNYELGTDVNNMLRSTRNELTDLLISNFR
jgi:glycosyltransferase involved in cell wall biosynthesis